MRWLRPNLLRLRIATRILRVAVGSALLACSADPSLTTRHERNEEPEASLSDFVPASSSPDPFDAGTARADARTMLVVPGLWLPVGPFEDPFDDGPEVPRCSAIALMAEILGGEPAFSVNTGDCDYVTVSQPIQRAIAAGETIKVRLWHFELSAPEPALAHAAVLVDGLAALDERVPIPQPGGLITRELQLVRAVPVGALVHFHLHNHGANSWSLVEVSAGP